MERYMEKYWKHLDPNNVLQGHVRGLDYKRRMCRLFCFQWNVACIVAQTNHEGWLYSPLLFTSFPSETLHVQTEVKLMYS